MTGRLTSMLILGLAVLLAASWFVLRDLSDIATESPTAGVATPVGAWGSGREPVRIGVISRFAPNLIYAGYQPIMDYLNHHGRYQYELTLSTSYIDAVERLRSGDVVASFLGAWIYGHLEAESGLVPVVAPLNANGRSEFRAVLVVGPDSPLRSVGDLRGQAVAIPSPQSWSGNWLQTAGLARAGLAVSDLASIQHFDHHQTVAWQVLRGRFAAGVVKESVAAEFASEGLRAIARSEPIPGPPLAGGGTSPAEVLTELRNLLLALDARDPADRAVLAGWSREFSHGFTAVDRQLYVDAFGGEEATHR